MLTGPVHECMTVKCHYAARKSAAVHPTCYVLSHLSLLEEHLRLLEVRLFSQTPNRSGDNACMYSDCTTGYNISIADAEEVDGHVPPDTGHSANKVAADQHRNSQVIAVPAADL
jgi:hypothetical protein